MSLPAAEWFRRFRGETGLGYRIGLRRERRSSAVRNAPMCRGSALGPAVARRASAHANHDEVRVASGSGNSGHATIATSWSSRSQRSAVVRQHSPGAAPSGMGRPGGDSCLIRSPHECLGGRPSSAGVAAITKTSSTPSAPIRETPGVIGLAARIAGAATSGLTSARSSLFTPQWRSGKTGPPTDRSDPFTRVTTGTRSHLRGPESLRLVANRQFCCPALQLQRRVYSVCRDFPGAAGATRSNASSAQEPRHGQKRGGGRRHRNPRRTVQCRAAMNSLAMSARIASPESDGRNSP